MTNTLLPTDRLLNTNELATVTGLCVDTLKHWRAAGRGPVFMKLGASVRYRRADVEAWLTGAAA